MVDKIKDTQQIQTNRQIDQNKTSRLHNQGAGSLTGKAATTHSDSDWVSLTDTAGRLHLLQEQIANQPIIDNRRVNSIKKAIADGSFQTNTKETAEKMINLEQLLRDALRKE